MADCAAPPGNSRPMPQGLVWSSDDQPGISRRRAGAGFAYRDAAGLPLRSRNEITRIRNLTIPPAWTDVWISPNAPGHIQATGRDAKGRKQYRYHADWNAIRSGNKFDRLPDFAKALPRLRRQIETDLSEPGAGRNKVLAASVRLLELTLIRVGNVQYARQNRSYGLTTLHKRHLTIEGVALRFTFRGKSGVDHKVSIHDRRLATVARSLWELPGQTLFQYRDPEGDLHQITSDDVNAYIRAAMGDGFSAKDFRTWAGTVSAARLLRECAPPTSPTDARRKVVTCLRAVAGLLGNTPSVCRASYVHPLILALFETGEMADALPGPAAAGFEKALAKRLSETGHPGRAHIPLRVRQSVSIGSTPDRTRASATDPSPVGP